MLLESWLLTAFESDVHHGRCTDVRSDAERNRAGECNLPGTIEHRWMRVLPERSDDHLPGLRGRDRCAAATTGQDRVNGCNTELRHERRRNSRVVSVVGKCHSG